MSETESKIETINQENVVNDLDDEQQAKIAALKAKAAAKAAAKAEEKTKAENITDEDEVPPLIVQERKVSIRFGIVGSGQAGSRLAEQFYKLGYPAVVFNTAPQDLEDIQIPEENKFLLDFGLGGAAKDLEIGHDAADAYRPNINQLIQRKLDDVQVFIFCTSLGGGSGAGSVEVMVDLLSKIGKPVIVLTVLPKASEDAQLKYNAWQTLNKFTKMFNDGKIDNIIAVDNAKIESLYSNVNPFNFFSVSNKAIVEPIHLFNKMSRRKDEGIKVLDSSEFGKLFTDGKGFTVYGETEVEDYEDEMAIATAIVESVGDNLLASGFDIKQARYAGFMLIASEDVWDRIPSSSLNFAQHMIDDACESPLAVFHGVYREDIGKDCVKVVSMFSGLGLPTERINQLTLEAQQKMGVAKKKDNERKMTMKVNVGEEVVNKTEEIRKKIQNKASAFSKLHGGAIQDRRKK